MERRCENSRGNIVASLGKILIIVQNLPVPFDRRVWLQVKNQEDMKIKVVREGLIRGSDLNGDAVVDAVDLDPTLGQADGQPSAAESWARKTSADRSSSSATDRSSSRP